MPAPHSTPQIHPLAKLVLAVLILLVLVAPLFRAGNTPLASLALQWLAIALLTLSLWSPKDVVRLNGLEFGLLLSLLITPLLYLAPLPSVFVDALPGRELYVGAEALLSAETARAWKPISLDPQATRSLLTSLLVPVAVFVAVRRLDAHALQTLVKILIVLAVLEAVLGLVQYGAGQSGNVILTVDGGNRGSAVGTYANRNHLAGLLAMTLPVALALFYHSLGRKEDLAVSGAWRRRAAFLGSRHGNAAILYGAAVLILLVGLVFTRSRMGIAMGMLGLVLTTLIFARRIGGTNVFGLTGTLIAMVLGFGAAIGLAPVLDRFSVAGAIEDARGELFASTLRLIGDFFPFGSGPASFSSVFPRVQPVELGAWFINRAHNDYLEWILEGGVIALLIIVLGLVLYVRQCLRVYVRGEWSRMRFLQAGAGVGLLALMLHELVDYNLAIPANQVFFALLAGLFLMPPDPVKAPGERRRVRRTPKLEPEPAPVMQGLTPPPDQIDNPFGCVIPLRRHWPIEVDTEDRPHALPLRPE
jgi:O-antigen ligase